MDNAISTFTEKLKEQFKTVNWKIYLIVLILLCLLVFYGLKVIETCFIYDHPATSNSYARSSTKHTKINKNIVTKKTKTTKPNGEIIETEEITDKTTEETVEKEKEKGKAESKPVFQKGATIFLTGGYSLQHEIQVGIGIDVFMLRFHLTHYIPASPLDMTAWKLNPVLWVDIPLF